MTATVFTSSASAGRPAGGFTLIELAIVIFIITLMVGFILVPLQSQIENRRFADTQRILDQAREALIGYAAANGYFPCPADFAGGSAGAEVAHNIATGSCAASVLGAGANGVYIGYLPAVTLGFTPTDANGYAVDAWGLTQNRIRYAISTATVNGVTLPFTRTSGMRNAQMSNILNCVPGAAVGVCALPVSGSAANGLLFVCNTAAGSSSATGCAAGTIMTSNAIAVIWSVGANAATTGGTSADEAENAESLATADRVFVMHDKSGVTGSEFDDIVIWISTPILFSRLIAAGQLP